MSHHNHHSHHHHEHPSFENPGISKGMFFQENEFYLEGSEYSLIEIRISHQIHILITLSLTIQSETSLNL